MSELQQSWVEGRVIRLNMSHEPNVAYAKTLDVVDLPTFILFDDAGNPLRRWVGEAPPLHELVYAGAIRGLSDSLFSSAR